VTIVDPRHPLCGRTLPLVGITQKAYLGRCCVVWIREDVERHVPVTATDLEFNPNTVSPIPLAIDAVRQLVHIFEQIVCASKGEEVDGSQSNAVVTRAHERDDRQDNCPRASVEEPCHKPTRALFADGGADLSRVAEAAASVYAKRGAP
jgi:hypothetical protein